MGVVGYIAKLRSAFSVLAFAAGAMASLSLFAAHGTSRTRTSADTLSRIDMDFIGPSGRNVCGGTLVSKVETQIAGLCRAAFFTAGHCTMDDMGRPHREKILFSYPGTSLERPSFSVLPRDIRAIETPHSAGADRASDYAVVYLDVPCANIARLTPVRLGSLNQDGTVAVGVGDVLSMQKRNTAVQDNVGGGGRLSSTARSNPNPGMISTEQIPQEQRGIVTGGDSGVGVFNANGELVGALTSGTSTHRDFSIAERGLAFLVKSLQKAGMPFDQNGAVSSTAGQQLASLSESTPKAGPQHGAAGAQPQTFSPAGGSRQPASTPSQAALVASATPTATAAPLIPGLAFDQASNNDNGPARISAPPVVATKPKIVGPGTEIPTLSHVRKSDESWAYVINTEGGWSNVRILEDGTLELVDGKKISAESKRELLLAYEQTYGTGVYGDKSLLVSKVVDKYKSEIDQWRSELDAQRIAQSERDATASAQSSEQGTGPAHFTGANFGPQLASTGPGSVSAATRGIAADSAEASEARKVIASYNDLRYEVAGRAPRERFTHGFTDIPQGGNGKLTFAYFADQDDPQVEAIAAGNRSVEVRRGPYDPRTASNALVQVVRYPLSAKEHSNYPDGFAVSIDGLGRKITRHGGPPSEALKSLLAGPEPKLLSQYRAALNTLSHATESSLSSGSSGGHAAQVSVNPRAAQLHLPAGKDGRIPPGSMEKCASCHRQELSRHPQVRNMVTADSVERSLRSGQVSESQLRAMFDRMEGQPKYQLTDEEKQSLLAFANETYRKSYLASFKGGALTAPRAQLMNAAEASKLPKLPKFEGESGAVLQQLVAGATPYTDKESPSFAQHENPNLRVMGIYNTDRGAGRHAFSNVSGGNGNLEFPWANPAGTDSAKNAGDYKFFIPPASGPMATVAKLQKHQVGEQRYKENGLDMVKPIYDQVGGMHMGRSNTSPVAAAAVQVGTVVGEVMTVSSPDGKSFPFTVRTRTMTPEGWKFDVFAPFANAEELLAAVRARPAWAENPQVIAFLKQMEKGTAKVSDISSSFATPASRVNSETEKLGPSAPHTGTEVLQKVALAQELPPLPPKLVEELLTQTPFKSVFGTPWVKSGKLEGWAPVAKGFHIVPDGYMGHHIPTTVTGCTNCHNATLRDTNHFDPPKNRMSSIGVSDSQGNRDWYGHIRGTMQQPVAGHPGLTSGLFTLPVFNPSAPKIPGEPHGGQSLQPNPALRSDLIKWMAQ
jgi:hypothetical protein